MKTYYVYIMSSFNRTLYVGVTNNLLRRVLEHKAETGSSFTSKYKINRLVYYEITNVNSAINREKQLKGWKRFKKIELIEGMNMEWKDLSLEWISSEVLEEKKDPSLRSG